MELRKIKIPGLMRDGIAPLLKIRLLIKIIIKTITTIND
jgi:hypothetical protein